MDVPHPSQVSEHMRPILKYLVQAKQLDKVDPQVAYLCRLHAVKVGSGIRQNDQDTALLGDILGWLEQHPHIMDNIPTTDRQSLVDNLAAKIFESADTQDRSPAGSNQNTCKAFLAVAILIDVCESLSPLSEELIQIRQYATWKAADIRRSLKSGVKPMAGGPPGIDPFAEPEGEEEMQFESPPPPPHFPSNLSSISQQQSPQRHPSQDLAPAPPHIDPEEDFPMPTSFPQPNAYGSTPSPVASEQSSYSNQSGVSSRNSAPSSRQQPPPQQPQASQAAPKPKPQPQPQQPKPQPQPQQNSVPQASPLPAVGEPIRIQGQMMPRGQAFNQADRLSKHASSAIAFEDVKTAVEKLSQALALLLPHLHTNPDEDY